MEEKTISFRLDSSELEALRKLAKREVRSMSGWLKFRVLEAIRAGLMSTEEIHQNETALSMEKKENREESSNEKRK